MIWPLKNVFYVCVLECLCKYLRMLERDAGSSGTRVIVVVSCLVWVQVLCKEQQVPLTTEPFLLAIWDCFLKFVFQQEFVSNWGLGGIVSLSLCPPSFLSLSHCVCVLIFISCIFTKSISSIGVLGLQGILYIRAFNLTAVLAGLWGFSTWDDIYLFVLLYYHSKIMLDMSVDLCIFPSIRGNTQPFPFKA